MNSENYFSDVEHHTASENREYTDWSKYSRGKTTKTYKISYVQNKETINDHMTPLFDWSLRPFLLNKTIFSRKM